MSHDDKSSRTSGYAYAEFQHKCVDAICWKCREGQNPEYQADPTPAYWHGAVECRASPIWLLDLPPQTSAPSAKKPIVWAPQPTEGTDDFRQGYAAGWNDCNTRWIGSSDGGTDNG